MTMRFLRQNRGQATVETAVIMTVVLMPVTFGLVMTTGAVLTWSGMIHLTRTGANYAATHCWQDSTGGNVSSFMQTHLPVMLDAQQLVNGPAVITVEYWSQDRVNHVTTPFECATSCSAECTPDSVTVTIRGYQFNVLTRMVGLQSIAMPEYSTTVQIESSGGSSEAVDLIR